MSLFVCTIIFKLSVNKAPVWWCVRRDVGELLATMIHVWSSRQDWIGIGAGMKNPTALKDTAVTGKTKTT